MATASSIPEARREAVSAIAHQFGVPAREISIAPRQGQVNLTIFLGRELVLRLPRKQEFERRLAKEAEVIPFVLDRGIPTAKLVSFDSGQTIADITYMVLERLHGRAIDDMPSFGGGGDRTGGREIAPICRCCNPACGGRAVVSAVLCASQTRRPAIDLRGAQLVCAESSPAVGGHAVPVDQCSRWLAKPPPGGLAVTPSGADGRGTAESFSVQETQRPTADRPGL